MPRAIWSGAISFGLVNIPIKLYAAVSRKSVHLNQLDSRTGSRIKYKKVSAADGEEVPSEALVKGSELSSGEYFTVDDPALVPDPKSDVTGKRVSVRVNMSGRRMIKQKNTHAT